MTTTHRLRGALAACLLAWSAIAASAETLTVTEDQMDAARAILARQQPTMTRQEGKPDPSRGPITNLPLPRYVSLKGSEGNARRGPSLSHRIDWVFRHAGMPLQVIAEYGHWRRVIDQDGQGGWVHYSLLSGVRTVVVTQDLADLLARPQDGAAVTARAESGSVLRLGECRPEWCRVSGGGESGWVAKRAVWGVNADELRD